MRKVIQSGRSKRGGLQARPRYEKEEEEEEDLLTINKEGGGECSSTIGYGEKQGLGVVVVCWSAARGCCCCASALRERRVWHSGGPHL